MDKPDIILILADDIGYGDFGCFNSESRIPTPNLDYLAKIGMSFADSHSASAVCTPSRYGVLTGRYCFRSPLKRSVLVGYEPPLIEPERMTIASLLKSQGYRTGCVGKWHVGMGFQAKDGMALDFQRPLPWGEPKRAFEEKIDFNKPMFGGPNDLGFDTFFGTVGCSTCQPPYAFVRNRNFTTHDFVYKADHTPQMRPGIAATDWENDQADIVFLNEAVSFIEESAKSPDPMFLYFCPSAAHEPCTYKDTPEIARGKSNAGFRGDLVWLFDHMVGQIIETLKRTGRYDNTLLIVTSDNGALPGDRCEPQPDNPFIFATYGHKSNGDLRGYKSHIWEGGHRTPLLINWPGHTKPGSVCSSLVCLTDFFETFREITHSPFISDAGEDSFSILPMLEDPTSPSHRDHIVHHSQTGVFSLRRGKWKLIFECQSSGGWPPPTDRLSPVQGQDGQLYDIEADPYETTNVFDQYPEIVSKMSLELLQLKNDTRTAPMHQDE